MPRMTIYRIKELTAETNPHYFTHDTLRFFGQTLRMFTVTKQSDGRYKISAPSFWADRATGQPRLMGHSVRYFNPETNELEGERS